MSNAKSPFSIWGLLKGRLGELKTIYARYPKATKQVKGLLGKSKIGAAERKVDQASKRIARYEKMIAKTERDLLKYIKPVDKESRDSIRILKAVMKSDFPVGYKKMWRRK